MEIIKADAGRLEEIQSIYEQARCFMRAQGNGLQWGTHYPPKALIEEDLALGRLLLCVDGETLLGVFCYFFGVEPAYEKLQDGAWLNDAPYGVMHRVAVAKRNCGVASFCIGHCLRQCRNLKMDTHLDNLPMQRTLEANGLIRCGKIRLETGEEHIAYQGTLL